MRCSCCGYESLDLCQVSMTAYCGQMPRSENVECTARVLHSESCKEIKSCRGVKSPQNGEVLQKRSRSWLGGDDQTLCHMEGRWHISQLGCLAEQMEGCAAAIIVSAARREG